MRSYCLLFITFALVLSCSAQSPVVKLNVIGGIQNQSLKSNIEKNTNHLLSAINTAYINGKSELVVDNKIITPEALKSLHDLWGDFHFYCDRATISENLLTIAQSYQIRNIPIVFNNDEQSAVICYNKNDGMIIDFHFGLEIHHYNSIMQPEKVVDQTRREIILNFVEDFRTAYIRKDSAYISKVFSDYALIIVGRIIQQTNISSDQMYSNLSTQEVDYIVLNKSEYLERLSRLFETNDYLTLHFKDIEVNQHKKYPNFYGILLEQKWQWTNNQGIKGYGDEGYLFLVIQFRDNDHPLIWVRTWQDVNAVDKNDVFGLHNFRLTEGIIQY